MRSEYKHAVFVSYHQLNEDWVRYTAENLVRPLRSFLGYKALGSVFMDENIEIGADWPSQLAHHLAHSQLLLAVLSRSYFQSAWCRGELGLMYYREEITGSLHSDNPCGLIIPLLVDDEDSVDSLPPEVRNRKLQPFHDFANPYIQRGTPKYEALTEVLKQRVCPLIQKALKSVPAFDPSWENLAHTQFDTLFRSSTRVQTSPPSLNLAPLP